MRHPVRTLINIVILLAATQQDAFCQRVDEDVRLQPRLVADSCNQHDVCNDAIEVMGVRTDSSMIRVMGCNINALPDSNINFCFADSLPTVWYKMIPDSLATFMNLRLISDDLSRAKVQVFTSAANCDNLIPVGNCRTAFGGRLLVGRIPVIPLDTYYIAVVADILTGGTFELSVGTNSIELLCYTDGEIAIVSRSTGGELTDPLLPGEQVEVCMRVFDWQTFNYGCQWFQGMIPSFGPAWDDASFDSLHQPLNATIDSLPMGDPMNGLYDAVWNWYTDVEFHGTTSLLQVGDQDADQDIDICHSLYEDCIDYGGMLGGCCRPCYDSLPSDMLPPGWFADGINGSCSVEGHPNVEWGDGASCYLSDGPWSFCFDLQVEAFPACLQYPPDTGLKLKFITRSDAGTGGTTGDPLSCLYDRPEILLPPMTCGTQALELPSDTLAAVCSGDVLQFTIADTHVSQWYYNIEPVTIVADPYGDVSNGTTILQSFTIASDTPVWVTYYFRGLLDSADTYVTKSVSFFLDPAIHIQMDSSITVCKYETGHITIDPIVTGGSGNFEYSWIPVGTTQPSIELLPPHVSNTHVIEVTDNLGCSQSEQIHIIVDSNCFQDPQGEDDNDESNDPPIPQDAIPTGNSLPEGHDQIAFRQGLEEKTISIFPIPAKDAIMIELNMELDPGEQIIITDLNGVRYAVLTNDIFPGKWKSIALNNMNPGIYLVSLYTDRQVTTIRMVKI